MTCRDKFEIDHPSLVSPDTSMNVIGCPSLYGYLEESDCLMHCKDCEECWNKPFKINKGESKNDRK